jgi:hypothetical protein
VIPPFDFIFPRGNPGSGSVLIHDLRERPDLVLGGTITLDAENPLHSGRWLIVEVSEDKASAFAVRQR